MSGIIFLDIHFQQEPEEIILSQRAEYRIVMGQTKAEAHKRNILLCSYIKDPSLALLSHPDILSEVHVCKNVRDFLD